MASYANDINWEVTSYSILISYLNSMALYDEKRPSTISSFIYHA